MARNKAGPVSLASNARNKVSKKAPVKTGPTSQVSVARRDNKDNRDNNALRNREAEIVRNKAAAGHPDKGDRDKEDLSSNAPRNKDLRNRVDHKNPRPVRRMICRLATDGHVIYIYKN